VVLITMLIKRDEKVGFITGREHFARADADLKDGRAAGNRGRDRHVSHDILVAASGQPREKRAGGLNSVLRISGEADDCVLNIFWTQISPLRCRTGRGRPSGAWHIGRSTGFWNDFSRIHATSTVSKLRHESSRQYFRFCQRKTVAALCERRHSFKSAVIHLRAATARQVDRRYNLVAHVVFRSQFHMPSAARGSRANLNPLNGAPRPAPFVSAST